MQKIICECWIGFLSAGLQLVFALLSSCVCEKDFYSSDKAIGDKL